MVNAVDIPWQDVQTKGYVVVPGFLSAQEIALLVESFGVVADEERKNPNFNTRYLPVKTRSLFAPKILPVARRVSPPGMTMNKLRTAIYYATRLGVQWEWHTDSTSHYIHPSYLNFWIPLVKPARNRSGLSIIDFETLGARFPEIATHFVGKGATRVVVRDGKTVFQDNATLTMFEVPDPNVMEELAVTPDLGPGDLLLLRSDVFHRSQDGETERLAISFRVVSSTAIVTRQMLMTMGAAKFNNMARMRTHFAKRFATFEIAQREELSSAEYDALYYELEAREAALCQALGVKYLSNSQFEDMIYEMRSEHARKRSGSSG